MSQPLLVATDLVKRFPIRGGLLGRQVDSFAAVDGVTRCSVRSLKNMANRLCFG